MAMGMSYQDYWYGEPNMVKSYRDAYKIKQDEDNLMAWLQGMYNYVALGTALGNSFSNQKQDYPNKPFDLHKKEETPEQIRERYFQRFKQMEEVYKRSQSEEWQNG